MIRFNINLLIRYCIIQLLCYFFRTRNKMRVLQLIAIDGISNLSVPRRTPVVNEHHIFEWKKLQLISNPNMLFIIRQILSKT